MSATFHLVLWQYSGDYLFAEGIQSLDRFGTVADPDAFVKELAAVCSRHIMPTARPEPTKRVTDSTGQPIKIGDRVRFQGNVYTVKGFRYGERDSGIAVIEFNEPLPERSETPDEISVDLVRQ